jgi:hypothetical protein
MKQGEFSLKKNEMKILYYNLGLIILNIVLSLIASATNTYQGDGQGPSVLTQVLSMEIAIFIFGFIGGSVVSTIPFRTLPYSKKYLRSSLITIFVLNVLFLIIVIRSLIVFSSF